MKKKFYHTLPVKKLVIFCICFLLAIPFIKAQSFIYGMTSAGGANGYGTLFKIDETATPAYSLLSSFVFLTGSTPQGSLIKGTDQMLYGMTEKGSGADSGVIFKFNPYTNVYDTLTEFKHSNGNFPAGSLLEEGGMFYGLTMDGGVHDSGTIFRYNPKTNAITVLHSFTKATGARPNASLVMNNGKLYGATTIGGTKDSGVLFSIDTTTFTYTDLVNLNRTTGAKPFGNVTITGNNLFLMTSSGGVHDSGAILEYNISTTAASDYHDFTRPTGAGPLGDLLLAGGKLYGMTSLGGVHDSGAIFMIDLSTSIYSLVFSFTKVDGTGPKGSLMLASNGYLYGMTRIGGTNGDGVIFRMDTTTLTYAKLVDFAGASNGQMPVFTRLLEVCLPPVVSTQPNNAKLCANGDTSFTTKGTATTAVTYQWKVDSGTGFMYLSNGGVYNGATSTTLTITGATAGMSGYTYECTMMDGCTDSTTTNVVTLTVNPLPTLTITSNPAKDSVCIGSKATLTAGGAKTYAWTGSITNGVAFTPAATMQYLVTGTDANGCVNKDSVTIVLDSLPKVSFTSSPANDTICNGASVTLTGTGNAGSYSWNNGVTDGVAFTPTATATYIVTGTAANGCTNTDTVIVAVDNIAVTITGNVTTGFNICATKADTLMANTTSSFGALTYSWSTSGTYDTAIVSTGGTYSVTVTDVYGCSNSASVLTRTRTLPTFAIVSAPANDTVCFGDTVNLSGSAALLTYTWSGGITNGVAFTPGLGTTTYIVTGKDKHGCTNNDTVMVTADTLPKITVTGNDTIVAGQMDTLKATGAVTYVWQPSGGTNDSIKVSPSTTTTYTVTGTGANGCMATDSSTVVVKVITAINAVNNNNGTSLYPNPASDEITLAFNVKGANVPAVITIVDIIGKELISTNATINKGKTMQMDISSLPAGVYFVKVVMSNKSYVTRFIKE